MGGGYINNNKIGGMCYNGEVIYKSGYKIPSFSEATDQEIAVALDLHYHGKINIADYWKVGDTRIIHLNAMSSGTGANESHVAQNMTMVIIGIEHDTLKTPVNGKTKAAITLQCREVLANRGAAEEGYIFGSSQNTSSTSNYSTNPRRTWLNGTFINSLPSYAKALVKTVIKTNLGDHSSGSSSKKGPDTEDKAFLLSYPEMFGRQSYNYYNSYWNWEGQQYTYYKSSSYALRTKYGNNNGIPNTITHAYMLRSPSEYDATAWMIIDKQGVESWRPSYQTCGIAPAFCL